MKIRCIFAICLVLAAAGVGGAKSEESEYYAVFAGGKKMGYSIWSRVESDDKVTTTETMSILVKRVNEPVLMTTTETNIEMPDGKPLGFKLTQNFGSSTTIVSGKVDELWIVDITAISMGREQRKSMGWPSGAVLNEGLRLLQLEKGLQEGLEYSAKIFELGSLRGLEAKIRIGPKKNIDLLGRVAALTEVKTTIKVPAGGEIVRTSYVDENLRAQKSIVPLAGMKDMEIIACSKEFALGENDVVELVDKMFLASPEPLDDIESARSATYYLKPSGESMKLAIPSSDNQSVEQKEGEIMVTVTPAAAPAWAKFPYEGEDSNTLEAMKSTSYVQSDNNDVIALARRAAGETKDAYEAVKKIESFVSSYIENKSLSVGYASATEVAASRSGDCTEFAVLTAAMCRAIGIPAKVVFGLVYVKEFAGHENVFGGHAWVEAYVGGKWVGLDATRAPKGFDAGHIALAIGNGEPADFLNLAATLGQFKIEKVIIDTGKTQDPNL